MRHTRTYGLFTAIIVACSLAACADDGGTDALTSVPPAVQQIGPQGGSLDLGSGATIRIPAGALSQTVEIGLEVADARADVADPYRAGQIYTFTPLGLNLDLPAEVTIPNGGSGDGLLVVTLGGSGGLDALARGVASGAMARGALSRLGPVWVTQRGGVVETLSLKLSGHELQAGDVVSLDLEALNVAGGLLSADQAIFTSSDVDVVRIDTSGERPLLLALSEGQATVTAELQDATTSVEVTVVAGDVARLEVLPAELDMARRDTAMMTVRAFDAAGNETDLPANLRWSSSNRSVARVDVRGRVTTHASGTARIVASGGGALGEATVTVAAPIATRLTIWPERPTVGMGETRQVVARTLDEFGELMAEGAPAVTWSTTNPEVATVDGEGRVTGVELGATELIATSADPQVSADTVRLTVGASRPAGLQIITQPSGFIPGAPLTVQPVVQVVDAFGNAVLRSGITVRATVEGGSANLLGSPSAATNDQGTATFQDLAIDGPLGTYRLEFGMGAAAAVQSDAIEAVAPMVLVYSVKSGDTFTLPVDGDPTTFGLTVDWGDGTIEPFGFGDPVTHTFSAANSDQRVHVYGTADQFGAGGSVTPGTRSLKRVESWGELGITSLAGAFAYAEILTEVPATLPPGVTDLSSVFNNAKVFNGDLSKWDVSSVTTLERAFTDASAFNGDISTWNVSNVTTLDETFFDASAFNRDLSQWNVSKVKSFDRTFKLASAFNNGCAANVHECPLTWGTRTASVTTMEEMFMQATTFDQNIASWDVSNVEDMSEMFDQATAFNNGCARLTETDTETCPLDWSGDRAPSSVEEMWNMFKGALSFNQDISTWDVSSVESMSSMFESASAFNNGCAPLTETDTETCPLDWSGDRAPSNVTNMREMFKNADAFNQDVSSWNVSNVTNMREMFMENGAFNNGCAADTYTCPLTWSEDRAPSNVTSMESMFQDARKFNQDVSSWDVSSVRSMEEMFEDAKVFNNGCAPLSVDNTKTCPLTWSGARAPSNVTDMADMFKDASRFNQNVSSWNVSSVTDMDDMFEDTDFNNGCAEGATTCPLLWTDDGTADGASTTLNVRDFSSMFQGAKYFNQNISNWNVSSGTNMREMFNEADDFNQDLSLWCVEDLSAPIDFDESADEWDGDPPNKKDAANRDPGSDWGRPVWGTCPSTDD